MYLKMEKKNQQEKNILDCTCGLFYLGSERAEGVCPRLPPGAQE
jgi:hypothetical protein